MLHYYLFCIRTRSQLWHVCPLGCPQASGVTSKAANGDHFKTGQRKWPGTRLFYSVAS